MNNELMIVRGLDTATLEVLPSSTSLVMVEQALQASALIGRVTNPAEQEVAFGAQSKLITTIRAIEKARKEFGAPFVQAQRQVNALAKELTAELLGEEARVGALVDRFQVAERQRAALLQQQQQAEFARLAADAAKLEAENKPEEAAALQAEAAAVIRAPRAQPAKADGQVTTEDWDVEVTDIHALYAAFPTCVKLEPLIGEIKMRLGVGLTLPGVTARKVLRSTFRGRSPIVIDT